MKFKEKTQVMTMKIEEETNVRGFVEEESTEVMTTNTKETKKGG